MVIFAFGGLVAVSSGELFAQTTANVHFYVSPTGSDSSAGSAAQPWRTIAFALSRADSGSSVFIQSGMYNERATLQIPCGVNLIGAGSDLVHIMSRDTVTIRLDNCLSDENMQQVSGFSMDGADKTIAQGIRVNRVHGLTLFDISGGDFEDSAIMLDNLVDSEIYDLNLRPSGKIFGDLGCGGTLTIGNLTRTRFHDLTIDGGDAYGIKAVGEVDYPIVIDSEFFNIDIRVDPIRCSLWDNFAWEMFQVTMINTRIHHNRMNATLSLPERHNAAVQGDLRIDHTLFDLCDGGAYAIELDRSNVEVDHNLFTCGGYALASFGGVEHENLRVHHNLFINQNSVTNVMHFIGSVSNFSFDNNTVVSNNAARLFYIGDETGTLSGTRLMARNNVFLNTVGDTDTAAELAQLAMLDTNLFWGITPYGNNAIVQDPLLPLDQNRESGNLLTPFAPQSRSPAIGSGMFILGLTDETPDIGAIDSDDVPWLIGIQ